jgi:hypothetical protein
MHTVKAGIILAAIILAVLFGFVIGSTTVGEKEVAPQVTVDVKGIPEQELDIDNEFDEADQEEASDPTPEEGPVIHEDLRDETPPGVDLEDVEEINDDKPVGVGEPLPVGGAQIYSCPNRFVRNFSDRAVGSKVGLFVVHYTVSRPGTLDVIRSLFDRPSFGASSHLGLEPTGRCQTWVPFNKKAWTQGAYNSVSESVEIICCNTPQTRAWWLAQPIFTKQYLAAIIVDRLKARGIQPVRVDPVGCGVQRAGWTDHNALECGNSHHDVTPNFPYDVLQAQVVSRYNAGNVNVLPGPRPKPEWFWTWCGWALGGREPPRPDDAPSLIPRWAHDACNQWAEQH